MISRLVLRLLSVHDVSPFLFFLIEFVLLFIFSLVFLFLVPTWAPQLDACPCRDCHETSRFIPTRPVAIRRFPPVIHTHTHPNVSFLIFLNMFGGTSGRRAGQLAVSLSHSMMTYRHKRAARESLISTGCCQVTRVSRWRCSRFIFPFNNFFSRQRRKRWQEDQSRLMISLN